MTSIKFKTMLKNKRLDNFEDEECEEFKRKKIELRCPNCGYLEQDPLYDSVCGACGHLR